MAMAICSCSKHSPAFPNISFSSYSTKSYLKVSSYGSPLVYTPSSSNYTCSTVQEDALVIPTAGIQQLAGAATASVRKTEKILGRKGSESDVEREHEWCNEAIIRRKRRRKIRSILERIKNVEDDKLVFVDKKAGKSRFMTPKEEARFSWYLKVYVDVNCVSLLEIVFFVFFG